MSYENISMPFAKDKDGKTVYIDECKIEDRINNYYCPVCLSEVRLVSPEWKTLSGELSQVTPHFSHFDASKCGGEGWQHWWYKNEFLKTGEIITITTNITKNYTIKEVIKEKSYETSFGLYQPDLSLLTDNDEWIFIEFAYTNKKKEEDYLDKWTELNKIVVSVDLKTICNSMDADIKHFSTLYYTDKVFSFNDNSTYSDTIGKYRDGFAPDKMDEKLRKRLDNLDWLWRDILAYSLGKKEITDILEVLDYIDDKKDIEVVINLLKKPKCNNILKDCVKYKIDTINKICEFYSKLDDINFSYEVKIPRLIFERIYCDYEIYFKFNEEPYIISFDFIHPEKLKINIENSINSILLKQQSDIIIDLYNKEHEYKSVSKNINRINEPKIYARCGRNGNCGLNGIILNFNNYLDYVYELNIGDSKIDLNIEIEKHLKKENCTLLTLNQFIFLDDITGILNKKYNIAKDGYSYKIYSIFENCNFELYFSIESAYGKTFSLCNFQYSSEGLFKINNTNETLISLEELKNNIEETLDNIINKTIPISGQVVEALKLTKDYCKDYKTNLELIFCLDSESEIEIRLSYNTDRYMFSIIENDLYKYDTYLTSFKESSSDDIFLVFKNIINNIFIESFEVEVDSIKEIAIELNESYSKIEGEWKIRYIKYSNTYKSKIISLNKNSEVKDKYLIKDEDMKPEDLIKIIKTQFSKTIRDNKYNMGVN